MATHLQKFLDKIWLIMQKVSAYNKALMGKGAKFWFLHVVIIGQNSPFSFIHTSIDEFTIRCL